MLVITKMDYRKLHLLLFLAKRQIGCICMLDHIQSITNSSPPLHTTSCEDKMFSPPAEIVNDAVYVQSVVCVAIFVQYISTARLKLRRIDLAVAICITATKPVAVPNEKINLEALEIATTWDCFCLHPGQGLMYWNAELKHNTWYSRCRLGLCILSWHCKQQMQYTLLCNFLQVQYWMASPVGDYCDRGQMLMITIMWSWGRAQLLTQSLVCSCYRAIHTNSCLFNRCSSWWWCSSPKWL